MTDTGTSQDAVAPALPPAQAGTHLPIRTVTTHGGGNRAGTISGETIPARSALIATTPDGTTRDVAARVVIHRPIRTATSDHEATDR
jgi:hypothetical protein